MAVLASVSWPTLEVRRVRTGRLAVLTPRYRQILGLIAQGMTNNVATRAAASGPVE